LTWLLAPFKPPPDDRAVFVNRAHTMQRHVSDRAVLLEQREGPRALRVESNRDERDDDLSPGNAILVPEREVAFPELGVPDDPMEQVLKGLHVKYLHLTFAL